MSFQFLPGSSSLAFDSSRYFIFAGYIIEGFGGDLFIFLLANLLQVETNPLTSVFKQIS